MGVSSSRSLPYRDSTAAAHNKVQWKGVLDATVQGIALSRVLCALESDRIHVDVDEKQCLQILLDDLIHVDLLTEDENRNVSEGSARLRVIGYPLVEGRRQLLTLLLNFDKGLVAQQWSQFIHLHITARRSPHLRAETSLRRNRRILAIVNPFSGQKKALQLWHTYVEPIFQLAQLDYQLILTEYERHATEIARRLVLEDYDGLAVVSGDGLVSEVIAGFLLRPDRKRALKMPIAHIPGGTSNGLAAAVCFHCNEPFSPRDVFCVEAALMVARPRYLPLRVCHVQTECNGDRAMFMSATWGLVADIDIGSERFRWAGLVRFHIEATIRIMQLPTVARYRARVSFLPVNDVRLKTATRLRHIVNRSEFGRRHFEYEEVQGETSDEADGSEAGDVGDALRGADLICHGNMPQLSEPVPDDWVTIEGDFVYVCAVFLSHLGSDLPFIPSSRLDDDIVYLTLVDWNVVKSRFEVAKMMITIDGSHHLKYPCLQIIPVRGCRIEPLDNCGGYIAVDGEPIKPGTAFQVSPSKYRATVIGRKERL